MTCWVNHHINEHEWFSESVCRTWVENPCKYFSLMHNQLCPLYFLSERLLLPSRGTLFYWTHPESTWWACRFSRASCYLSKSCYRKPQEKKECWVQRNTQPMWSARCVSEWVWGCRCLASCASVSIVMSQARTSHKCTVSDLSNNVSYRCSRWLCPRGEGEGGVGEGAAEEWGSDWAPLPAFGQQRAVGGDHGGGRLQTDRIPRQR